ncbi:7862_t:CDS:2 [Acaulospora morrowiae]|uniref:7862_t:CDS:1 n=1 Tax=Acaulospora morrowiae TaxID=94023 RepID=A0A9N8YVJ2_9GLOM|nr:7862_t:CDS:2 [Acaulospora morrowiae]
MSEDNEPPLVKYKYPLIGHTWDYLSNVGDFIAKCRAQYGNIFTINVHGRMLTIVGKEYAHEIFVSKDCSFARGFDEITPLNEILGLERNFTSATAELVRKTLMDNVDVYTHHFQNVLHEKVEEEFGNLETKNVDSPLDFVQDIVSKTMASILLGEEARRVPEMMSILLETSRVIGESWFIPNTLSYIHPYLHRLRVLWTVRRAGDIPQKNMALLAQLIKPIVDDRIRKEKTLGSSWKEPVDLLSGLINNKRIDKSNVDYRWIAVHIQLMVFVAVHSTAAFGANCLIGINWEELLEEQLEVNPENKKIITNEETNKMERMDSFIKESLRMSGVVVDMYHKVLESGFQFSNGYSLPPGSMIAIDKNSIHFDQTYTFGNPLEFDGNRYFQKDSPSTKVGKTYIAFGLGRHVCPGRFFAVLEIKLLMAHLIRSFVIKPVGKTRIKNLTFAGFIIPFDKLVFERRTK